MDEPSRPTTLPYQPPPTSRPSALALGALWTALVLGVMFEALLYDIQRPNNIQSGTVGSLLKPGERIIARMIMAAVGLGLVVLLYACVRFTRRFLRPNPSP